MTFKLHLCLASAALTMLCLSNCKTFQKNTNLEELAEIIEMKKGPCFGSCPVFTLTIYNNGVASYEGERFTDRMGVYTKVLDKTTFESIVADFKLANLWQFQDAYKARIPDLATVSITYWEEDKSKTVLGKDGRPETVLKLEEKLDEIANSSGWEVKKKKEYGLSDNVIPNEIIVQLTNQVQASAWVRKYAKQEMEVIRSLSPNGYYWLVTFNESIIDPKDMLRFVQEDPYVISAEFNKKVEGRGRG
ncbi:MAG: hypothetical protein DHS20C18_51760 [Saprospiraceae bacterium]|nr:MAG: hypothetical protein DHS20C18_51760 [Saprospiraceae bacterium]